MRERPWLKKTHSDLTCMAGWEKLQVPVPVPVTLRQEQAIKDQWYKQESECGSVCLARGTRQRVGGCLWSSNMRYWGHRPGAGLKESDSHRSERACIEVV